MMQLCTAGQFCIGSTLELVGKSVEKIFSLLIIGCVKLHVCLRLYASRCPGSSLTCYLWQYLINIVVCAYLQSFTF